jgi:hypothetical protein
VGPIVVVAVGVMDVIAWEEVVVVVGAVAATADDVGADDEDVEADEVWGGSAYVGASALLLRWKSAIGRTKN